MDDNNRKDLEQDIFAAANTSGEGETAELNPPAEELPHWDDVFASDEPAAPAEPEAPAMSTREQKLAELDNQYTSAGPVFPQGDTTGAPTAPGADPYAPQADPYAPQPGADPYGEGQGGYAADPYGNQQQGYQQGEPYAGGQAYEQGDPYGQNQQGYQQPYGQPQGNVPAPGTKEKLVAGLLGIFLGSLGIHKFYLGYNNAGLIMLLVTLVGSIITCGVSAAVMSIIGLIEGIIYLTKTDEQFYEIYVVEQKAWF